MDIQIKLYTVPQEACDSKKMNWKEAGLMLQNHLSQKLAAAHTFQHIEFMSAEWFEDKVAQAMMEKEQLNFPFVLVNGVLASSGNKIHLSQVLHLAQELSINK
jgi:hypothetical protein